MRTRLATRAWSGQAPFCAIRAPNIRSDSPSRTGSATLGNSTGSKRAVGVHEADHLVAGRRETSGAGGAEAAPGLKDHVGPQG